MRSSERYKSVSTPAWSWSTRIGTDPNTAPPVSWWLSLGLQPNRRWWTIKRDKKTLNHSGSIPNVEWTLEKIVSCRYKTKMDKGSGFWQVDLTPNAQELLAFITPQGRGFNSKVMPFGVANAPALFHELMNKILSILHCRPVVQELMSRGAQMEAHIEDVCLGTDSQEEHLILLCSTWGSTLAVAGGPPRPLWQNP